MNKKIISFLLISLLLCGCSSDKPSDEKSKDTEPSSSSAEASPTEGQESPTDATEEKKKATSFDKIGIEYKRNDKESVVKEVGNTSEISLGKPSFLKENDVFTGWKEENIVSEIMDNALSENQILMTAESTDVSTMENVIFNNSVYVKTEEADEFVVPVTIGGMNDFAVLTLEIGYDAEKLKLMNITSDDSDAVFNHVEEENKILISFVSAENIESDLILCNLEFKALSDERATTALSYNVMEIAAWAENKEEYRNVNYNIVNGKIVMY